MDRTNTYTGITKKEKLLKTKKVLKFIDTCMRMQLNYCERNCSILCSTVYIELIKIVQVVGRPSSNNIAVTLYERQYPKNKFKNNFKNNKEETS